MSYVSQLPLDLLAHIMDYLQLPDLIRFGCVCTSWRSVSAPARHKSSPPWLIVPFENNSKAKGYSWVSPLGFYSLLDKQVHKVFIPEMEDRRICGSSNGWLITIHENSDILLLHPFSRQIIGLPSLLDFPRVKRNKPANIIINGWGTIGHEVSAVDVRDTYIKKAIVSNNSTLDKASLVVMAIVGPFFELLFCRPGMEQKTWTQVQSQNDIFWDVICFNGKFYALSFSGNVVVVEGFDSLHPITKRIILTNNYVNPSGCLSHLVESSGNLLKVKPVPKCFKVWKLDFENEKWLEVENLGNRALFVGINESFSISTSDFPGCKRNCIYFAHHPVIRGDYYRGRSIYNLEDGIIEKLFEDDSEYVPPPFAIWYAPKLGQC